MENKIEEHIANFPKVSHYTEDALDYLHRNPGLTPGLFCLGASSNVEVNNWLTKLKQLLGIKTEMETIFDFRKSRKWNTKFATFSGGIFYNNHNIK